ncbi:hypothetical protein BJX66DRAFT_110122 [Aspergillus keveii]|uniref:Cell wall protein n=1 Tax=Aspergillus keveii TaxID=714993 RepID=A0ABR4FLH4_9EURO
MRLLPTLAIFSSLFLGALSLPMAQGPINLSCDQDVDSFIASLRALQPVLQEYIATSNAALESGSPSPDEQTAMTQNIANASDALALIDRATGTEEEDVRRDFESRCSDSRHDDQRKRQGGLLDDLLGPDSFLGGLLAGLGL